jgi:hypothetical protein
LAAALLCGASGLRAQGGQAPAGGGQAPAGGQAAAPAADQFLFNSDAGLVIFQVKPDKTADFESAWTDIKGKLGGSDKPDLKTQGESMNLFKVTAATAPDQPAIYVLKIEPAAKGVSYDPGKILYAPGSLWERKDADATYKKIAESLAAGFNVLPIVKVAK